MIARALTFVAAAGIDADTAQFLQAVAWETVQDYYGSGAGEVARQVKN